MVCLVCFSPDSDGSESGWWTISIWQLVSRVHCPNLVLFYFILGVFAPQKPDCGQGAVLSLCMVRPGSGRFGVGFWVGFRVGLRARDFPTEGELSRTPLIIRTVDQNQNPKLSNSLNRSLRSTHTQDPGPASHNPTPPYPRTHPRTPPGGGIEHSEQKWPLYSTSSSSELFDTSFCEEIRPREKPQKIPRAEKRKRAAHRRETDLSLTRLEA